MSYGWEIRKLTGTTSGVVHAVVFGAAARVSGRVHGLTIRGAGAISSLSSIALVHSIATLALDAVPPREHVVHAKSSLSITPSATAASLEEVLASPRAFSGGLAIVANVVASGAYELFVAIERD
jgi:hypothetical protein